MIDYALVMLDGLALHQVGNKHHKEENFVSGALLTIRDEELENELFDFFLKPFEKANEVYQFRDFSEESNEIYSYAKAIFEDRKAVHENSVKILQHLYTQSDHPHIKVGELFVARFSEILFEDELTEVVGIFKTERKDSFFQFPAEGNMLHINTEFGINPGKLDKACLIFNLDEEEGYRVLTLDKNKYDAEYWKVNFLNIDYADDHNFQTKNYVELCKDFSEQIIAPSEGKKEQITFLNQTANYLTNNEDLHIQEFAQTLFAEEDPLRDEFVNFREEFETRRKVEFPEEGFKISQPALKSNKRKLKSSINLDTNIQIKLDFDNPESSKKFIEKGFDEERNMSFYKVYFNNERD